MIPTSLLFLLLSLPALGSALEDDEYPHNFYWERADIPSDGYYDPNDSGGSMLTQVPDTFPAGQGEPINMIVSALSDAAVLVNQDTDGGILNYFSSLHFSGECLGQHSGSDQGANLGDGNGYLNETAVMRWNYGDPSLGTCTETIKGGNHFRYWIQDGSQEDSGAIFMAVSYEMPISEEHDIIPNGYNLARDWVIGNITNSTVPTLNITNTTTYSGYTWSSGYTYYTDVRYVSGLLPNTSYGINHNLTVATSDSNACDGLVAVLRVAIHEAPVNAALTLIPSLLSVWLIVLLAGTIYHL